MTQLRTLLKRDESYAIHALIRAAERPGISAARIAEDLAFPAPFLAKVLRRLARAGLVENRVGRSGGVTLAVDPGEVSLLRVIETVSGPLLLDSCQGETQCATQRRTGACRLKRVWLETDRELRRLLGGVTLADLYDPDAA